MLMKIVIIIQVVVTKQNVISTVQGLIRGVVYEGYVAYTGIPYATIADPKDRYKKAGIAPIWSDIREPRAYSCSKASKAEDCLQLDVYVPTVLGKSWPVLVWVAGGSGPYNPGRLVREGIIVIVVNHRFSFQGFMCGRNDKIPGNAGVKDVIQALIWVRDNIVAFYGSPDKIVIAGQGFGAAVVDTVILSSREPGLFHGAILQSGTVLCPWAFNYDAEERLKALTDTPEIEDTEESVKSLLDTDIEELMKRSNKLDVSYFPFGICTEKPLKEGGLLYEAPYDLLLANKAQAIPMMIGYNSNEAYVFTSILKEANVLRRVSRNAIFLLPDDLKFFNDRERAQVARQIGNVYFKKNATMSTLLEYHRDAYFINHIHRSVQHYSSTTPVFYYQFSYTGDIGVQTEPDIDKKGAAHSDELAYLFNDHDLNGQDENIQRRLITFWVNFVKHLNPTPPNSEVSWELTKPERARLLDIGTELKMIDYPHSRTTRTWDDIYDKYYYSRNLIAK